MDSSTKSNKTRSFHIGLLPRIIIAITLGIGAGYILPLEIVRIFVTFNGLFSQFLNFIIPLIIVGLVAPAIADIGTKAGKMLIVTVLLAYIGSLFSGFLAFGVGELTFPPLLKDNMALTSVLSPEDIKPYFTIDIPAPFGVMTALVLAFLLGLGIAYSKADTMMEFFKEFRNIIEKTIKSVIIPVLPIYIFGIFLNMTHTGQVMNILSVFIKIIAVIFILHILLLILQFSIAGATVRKNPFKLLWRMMPAYFTALGTQSSAATIPVTMKQAVSNGVKEEIAGFTIPLCATIHLSGSTLKIVCCALALMMLQGLPYNFQMFAGFIFMLGITMVAAPGVPGGAIMASLGILSSMLGFGDNDLALMIALYIAMDSFGTACNVTGDGAIALIVDKLFGKKDNE